MNSQQAFLVFQAIQRYASAVSEQARISLDHGRTKRERRHLQEAKAIAHCEVKDALLNLLDHIIECSECRRLNDEPAPHQTERA